MKLPFKFRGRCWLKGLDPSDIKTSLNDGDYVYGGYARMKFLFEDDYGDFIIDNNGTAFLVYPDSVVQLIGYDIDGNEVYEDDKLISDGGIEFVAELWAMGVNSLDADSLQGGIFNFKLKEKIDE